jgi:hypothetical protein
VPIAQGRSAGSRQLLILAFATIAAVTAMYFLFMRAGELASSGEVDINLGSSVFEAGNVERLSEDIADKGPLLMPDLIIDRDRDIYLQHIGDDEAKGWFAFAARPLEASRDCFVEWQADNRNFVDVCDGTIYDEQGSGLTAYPVIIDGDGDLSVDINAADRTDEPDDTDQPDDADQTGSDG